MVCHNYRRVPALAQAKKMIAEGAIGQVHHYHARYAQDGSWTRNSPCVGSGKAISGSGAHGDINVHLIDLGRYLVGEFKEVCGLMNTFIKERPLPNGAPDKASLLAKAAGKKAKARQAKPRREGEDAAAKPVPALGKVTVDDAALFIGRFENGALANLEATRVRTGTKEPPDRRGQRLQGLALLRFRGHEPA